MIPLNWYSPDINPRILDTEQDQYQTVKQVIPEESKNDEIETSKKTTKSKISQKKAGESNKDMEPTRVSNRSTKGQYTDAFAKPHFMIYV